MKQLFTKATLLLLLTLMTSVTAGSQSVNCLPSDIGKVLGMDGKVYATVSAAGGMGSVSGMIAYVNTSTHEGIAIGPADLYWNSAEGTGSASVTTAISACSNYTRTRPSAATTGWRLPSQADFNNMIGSDGCQSANNLRNMQGRQSSPCGVWAMATDEGYWSSTESSSGSGIYYNLWSNDCNSIAYGTNEKYFRPCFTFSVTETYTVSYRAYNTGTNTFETLTANNCTMVTSSTTTMGTANTETWYVVSSNVTVSSSITVNGTVHLILRDGAILTADDGIAVTAGNALYIYSQSSGTGQLIADATGLNGLAGIGGGSSVGNITIHGGNITATGGEWSAGIGGGTNGGGGSITIYGGNVEGIGWRVNNNGNAVGIGRGSSGAAVAIQADGLRLQYYDNGWQDVTYSQRAWALEKLRVRFFPCTEHSYSDGRCTHCGKYQWYTVTYDGNGSTGGSVPTDNTHYANDGTGTVTVLGNTGNLVRTGYTFTGWNTAADGSGTNYAANATFTIYENVTLYAQWVETNPTPRNLNVTTDGATATATWSGTATSYNISINGTVTNNVTSPYTFDVVPSSTYEVMVQADYGTDGVSFWTAVYRFTTPVIIEYTLNDSYGDGWNGNAITISDNCGIVETLTLSNGRSGSGTLTLPGDYYQFVWQAGNYSYETSFTLIVNGVTRYTDQAGDALSDGQVLYTFGTATDMMPRPTGLTTGTLGTREVRLSWTENGTATAWKFCVNDNENNPIAANSNPFTLTGLTPETDYTVKVRATDGYIESCWSDAVSFTTAVACARPEDLDQNNITYTTADVSWTGTSDSYVVQYGTWTQAGTDHVATETLTPYTFDLSNFSGTGTVAIRHYNVTDMFYLNVDDIVVKDANNTVVYSQNFEGGSIPANMSNIDMDGDGYAWNLANSYNITVNGSYGVYSASWTSSTGALTPDNWLVISDIPLGGSITFSAVGQDPSVPYENFAVYVIADNQFTQAYSGTNTSCQLTALTEGTPYVWRVKGMCGEESSRWVSSIFKTRDDLLVFTTAGNWNVLSNWTDADGNAATALPTANNKVRIDAAVTITDGVVATAKSSVINGGSITIEEGGQLKQGSTVKVTMHKGITGYGAGNEVAAGHYYLIATPHSCSYLEENTLFPYVLNVSDGDNDLYAFDPTQGQAWINYESNSDHSEFHTGDNYGLFNKKGYLYANAADKDLTFVGTVSSSLNNTLTDSYTYNSNSTDPFNGWKLVGNPFTCNSTISFVDGSDAPLGAIFYKMNNSGDGFVAYQDFVVLTPGEGAFIHYTQSGTIKYSSEVSGNPNNAVAETPLPMLPQHGLDNNQIAIVVLADNTNNSSIINGLNGQMVNVFMQGRTLYKDGDWNTLCLPFALNSFTGTPLEGATVKTLESTDFNDGTLTMNFSDDLTSINAGVPYIVKWTSGSNIVNPVFTGVTISNATANISTTYADFIGSYVPLSTLNSQLSTILDAHNPDGDAMHAAISIHEPSVSGWFTDATRTAPVTTIPFAADGTVTLYAAHLSVKGYGTGTDKWVFIASPVITDGGIAPDNVVNLLGSQIPENPVLYNYDLYRFNQSAALEWENYHQHNTQQEPFLLVNGQGYLYARQDDVNLFFNGTLNTANTKTVALAYDANAPHADIRGWNLVGNPFPEAAYIDRVYYKMNAAGDDIEAVADYTENAIPAYTGVMVKAEAGEVNPTVTFSKTAPETSTSNGGSLSITLSQQTEVTRSGSTTTTHDKAIISFNEGSQLGKFIFNKNHAKLYIPQGREDYAIAFSDKHGEMPLNFEPTENGEYTITVNPESVEMVYLHLIDNMTGADVDLLAEPNYTFTARITDYESRFRLVFVCGDANDDNGDIESFAFYTNGSWIITNEGKATLQVIDITGHILSSETVNGSANVNINAAAGVYMLRLVNNENVKVQKVIMR